MSRRWLVVAAVSFLVLLAAAFGIGLQPEDRGSLSASSAESSDPPLAAEAVPPQQEVPQVAMAALVQYLNTDCEVGEEGESLRLILAFQEELELLLIEILQEGPDPQALDEFESDLDQQWRRRNEFVGDMSQTDLEREGLSTEDAELALMTSEEEYKAVYTSQFIQKYKEKAAIALAAFGTEVSLDAVQGVLAETENADLQHIIELAMEQFQ